MCHGASGFSFRRRHSTIVYGVREARGGSVCVDDGGRRALSIPRRCGCCFFVPPSLLRALADGHSLRPRDPAAFGQSFADTAQLGATRTGLLLSTLPPHTKIPNEALQASPVHLFDCAHLTVLPGNPLAALDQAAPAGAAVAAVTAQVLTFYRTVLGRDSIDAQGGPVVSSLNYGQQFQNAFWSGQMMVYGNGDQHVFVDFWHAPDVICHEITHGVTERESGLVYVGESGAVNESISDCFAAVFHQWARGLPASDPSGWLLGAGILGPAATDQGFTCLRDMVGPTAPHCLTPQPSIYPNRDPAGDVHLNSGIPNRAFALFARAVGGNAYDSPIRLWYAACTDKALTANATIADFAAATIRAANGWTGPDAATLSVALRTAWANVKVVPTPPG